MTRLVENHHIDRVTGPEARARLRVLFLINKLGEQGGAERFTLGLAANLPRIGLSRGFA